MKIGRILPRPIICTEKDISDEGERFFMEMIGLDDPRHLYLAPYTNAEEKKMIERLYRDEAY